MSSHPSHWFNIQVNHGRFPRAWQYGHLKNLSSCVMIWKKLVIPPKQCLWSANGYNAAPRWKWNFLSKSTICNMYQSYCYWTSCFICANNLFASYESDCVYTCKNIELALHYIKSTGSLTKKHHKTFMIWHCNMQK